MWPVQKTHLKLEILGVSTGTVSREIWSKLLHGDCTDEQMYAYSYEESMKE